ncbi:hypothetical protein EG329_012799 [Mollisiaceae sp. DMI_Dod_QoI]|nr:hypothetical protein EG329_012799 [Helotiales sp. DMI_Dod_QoI]
MASKWKPHIQRIRELYIDENKTLDEVMLTMETERGFSARQVSSFSILVKSEFERQLRILDLKKNRKQIHFKFLKVRLEARRQKGKESEILLEGILIPKTEVQRKTKRCFVSTTELYNLERSKTPPGFEIITPTTNFYMDSVRSQELPWFFFVRQLNSAENLTRIIHMPEQLLRGMIPTLCPDPSPLVPIHLKQIIHHLCAIMPVEQDDNVMDILRKIFGGDYHEATTEFLKLAVYVLSNKLLKMRYHGDGETFCGELFKWFQMGRNYLFLQDILSIKMPTIEAFVECIFVSAMHAEDAFMIKVFLKTGLNPNMIVYDRLNFEKYTLLQLVVHRGNITLAEMLLGLGADVDATRSSFTPTPLQIAAQLGNLAIARLLMRKGAAVNESDGHVPSALQNAALVGNFEIASLLLENGADIDANFGLYGSALECAIRAGATKLVEMLLERGADINRDPGEWGNTPLQSAAMKGDRSMVALLLQRGADVNAPAAWQGGRTALQRASENGDLEMCQTLLQASADVNAAPSESRYTPLQAPSTTALCAAVASQDYELVALLLEYGADVNDRRGRCTALEEATRLNNGRLVKLLLSVGADPSEDKSIVNAVEVQNLELVLIFVEACATINDHALCAAIKTKNLHIVRILLAAGANPNITGVDSYEDTPLVQAVQLGEQVGMPFIQALIEAGADCDGNPLLSGLNALQTACRKGHIKVIQYLLDRGADLNWPAARHHGRTALQAAVEFGDANFVRSLIEKGADVNAPASEGPGGYTALQIAILKRKIDLVRILLDAGVHANDKPSDIDGKTSLQLAVAFGRDDLIQLLLDHGADVNGEQALKYGRTALQVAAESGNLGIVQLLLAKGADVNAPACFSEGFTALQAAASKGYLRIAKILLAKGAHVGAPRSAYFGQTALEAAAESGHIDMMKFLLNAGADITRTEAGRCQLRNAMEHATACGHDAAAKFLKYHQLS